MIRFLILSFFLICSLSVFGQAGSTSASALAVPSDQIGTLLEQDFIPLKQNDGWAWYDISNDSTSQDYFFTDYIKTKNGYSGRFVLKNDSMWGVMNSFGEEHTPFIYDSIILVNNYLFTRSDEQWTYHFANNAEDSLIQLELDSVFSIDNKLYLYANGKTGMILESGALVRPKYDGMHKFVCGIASYSAWRFTMTIDGADFNLLDQDGKELLPKNVWDLRCTEDQVFEFRRGEHPEYYSPYSEEIISPNGRDIIFYRHLGYKIYSEDKLTSELHRNDGSILKNSYDDYFILSNEFMAVRKNGKVGLLKNEILRSQIKYDQIIEFFEYDSDGEEMVRYFKFFQGDSCGLMNEFGVEKIAANYANILLTEDDDRFVVIDDEMCGVVDKNGREVIPMEYDHISFDVKSQLFTLQKNNRIGLFRRNGTELIPVIYERHIIRYDLNGFNLTHPLHVLGKSNKLYFANSKGLIDDKPANHYDYTGSVLKVYGESNIDVYALDERGMIEEKLSYPLYNPAIIHDKYHEKWSGLAGYVTALLEENQQKGYFGLRNYTKRGFAIPPKYRTIRPTVFGSVLGEVAFETDKIKWLDDVPMKIIRSYDQIEINAGTIDNYPLFNSEIVLPYAGTNSRRLNFELDRAQSLSNNTEAIFSESELQELIHFGDCAGETEYVRRFIKGGTAEICPIDSADLSLYMYYSYWNLLDAVRISPEMMKSVLNPKIGVRFKDSRQIVINTFSTNDFYDNSLEFNEPVVYEQFQFLTSTLFFEKSPTKGFGSLRNFFFDEEENEQRRDSIISAESVLGSFGELILAEVPTSEMAKIHLDYPNYFFYPDSINLSYEAGRITKRIDSNFVCLISPRGKILADSCFLIQYLNEERFAVLRLNGWKLIDRNGASMSDLNFRSVGEFSNNRAEFGLADGSVVLINSNGEEVMPLPEKRSFLDEDHYFFASNPSELFNQVSNLKDESRAGEKYTSKGFFVSKEDGKRKVRGFGSEKMIELKAAPKLKSFGNCLYFKKGKHFYSIDSNLNISKHKKVEKFRLVTPEIAWLEGKNDLLIDSDWNTIHAINKTERFEIRKGSLVILEGDSVKINFGSLKEEMQDSLVEKAPEVKVISKNGKYGVQRGEEVLLPLNYNWLSKVNDREFLTKIDSEKRLYNSGLDRIGNQPFDSFFQTNAGNFVFTHKGRTFVVSMDRTKTRLIN